MPRSLRRAMEQHAASFMAGRFDEMIHRYSPRLAVLSGKEIFHFSSHAEVLVELGDHRNKVLEAGVRRLEANVKVQDLFQEVKHKFLVEWTDHFDHDRPPKVAQAMDCVSSGPVPGRIEMIDFRELAFRDGMSWHGARSLDGLTPRSGTGKG